MQPLKNCKPSSILPTSPPPPRRPSTSNLLGEVAKELELTTHLSDLSSSSKNALTSFKGDFIFVITDAPKRFWGYLKGCLKRLI